MNAAALLLVLALGDPPPGVPPEEAAAAWRPDRSRPPEVLPPERLDLPAPAETLLGPGRRAWHLRVDGVRRVVVNLHVSRGRLDLCPEGGTACSALVELWPLAGGGLDAEALELALGRLDASLSAWMGPRATTLSLDVPAERLDAALALMEGVLREPGLPAEELRRQVREDRRFLEDEAPTDLAALASYAEAWAWFPPESPYADRPDLRALSALKVKDLRALHAALLVDAPLTVTVVGPVDEARALEAAGRLTEGWGAEAAPGAWPAFTPPAASRVVAVDSPGQTQAALRLRLAAPTADDADRVAFQAVSYALGGPFNSRLNTNLREEKGWTYGAGSWTTAARAYGLMGVYVDVPVERALPAMAEIEAELARLAAEGPTPTELASCWREDVSAWNRTLETSSSAAGLLSGLLSREEPLSAVAARVDAMAALPPDEARAAAARWLGPDAPRTWVVVGDRDALEAPLATLGLPVTWVSAEAAILGTF